MHDIGWITPLGGALITAVAVALFVTAVTHGKRVRIDTALSAIWAVGMAVGVSFVAATPGYGEDLMGYLFGADKIIAWGIGPFIVTDLMKLALAACILPAVWSLFKNA